jgi:hypothetical protein
MNPSGIEQIFFSIEYKEKENQKVCMMVYRREEKRKTIILLSIFLRFFLARHNTQTYDRSLFYSLFFNEGCCELKTNGKKVVNSSFHQIFMLALSS